MRPLRAGEEIEDIDIGEDPFAEEKRLEEERQLRLKKEETAFLVEQSMEKTFDLLAKHFPFLKEPYHGPI